MNIDSLTNFYSQSLIFQIESYLEYWGSVERLFFKNEMNQIMYSLLGNRIRLWRFYNFYSTWKLDDIGIWVSAQHVRALSVTVISGRTQEISVLLNNLIRFSSRIKFTPIKGVSTFLCTIQEAWHVHGHPVHRPSVHRPPIYRHLVPGYEVLTDTDHPTWSPHISSSFIQWGNDCRTKLRTTRVKMAYISILAWMVLPVSCWRNN